MTAGSGFLAALRVRNYAFYFWGNFASMIGTWMQRMAIGWLTWELTASAWWLGVIAFADLFPTVIVSPFAGVIADRFDRRRMILIAQFSSVTVTLVLLCMSLLGNADITVIVAVVVVGGIITGFDQPIRHSILGDLCGPNHLQDVVAINAMSYNLARVLGPAVAGFVLVHLGFEAVLIMNALSFAAFIFCVFHLRITAVDEPSSLIRHSMMTELQDGYRFILRSASLMGALLVLMVASLAVRPVFELLPAFAAIVQEAWLLTDSAAAVSVLATTLGIGAFAGVAAAPFLARWLGVPRTLWSSIWLACGCLMLFAAQSRPSVLLVLLAALSACLLVNSVAVQMVVHADTPSAFRGRVLSLQSLVFRGCPAFGAVCAGALADWLGLSLVLYLFAGAGVLALMVIRRQKPPGPAKARLH